MCTKTSPSFIEFEWKTKKFFNDTFNGRTVRLLRAGEFGLVCQIINGNLFYRQRNWLHEPSSPRWWCSFNSQTWHWNTGYKNKNWFSSFWWQWMAPHFGFTGILKGKFWIIFLLFFFFTKKKNFFHWNDFFPLFSCFYSMLNKHNENTILEKSWGGRPKIYIRSIKKRVGNL